VQREVVFSEWKVRPLRRRDESAVAVGVGRRCPGRSASTTSALIGWRRSSLSNRRSGGLCSRPGSCDLCHRLNDQVLTLLLLDKSVRRSTQFGAEVRVSGRLTIRSSSQIGCGRSRGLPAEEHESDHARLVAAPPGVSGGRGRRNRTARGTAAQQERQHQRVPYSETEDPHQLPSFMAVPHLFENLTTLLQPFSKQEASHEQNINIRPTLCVEVCEGFYINRHGRCRYLQGRTAEGRADEGCARAPTGDCTKPHNTRLVACPAA